MTNGLADWLSYIESLHPKSIAMGLDRVKLIIERMQLKPAFQIITVAGTNGKGSTCAILEQIYKNAGYQVGCYTSPHLLRYNERVRICGIEATDEELCAAFAAVDNARVDNDDYVVPLTYFEVGTLATIWHFIQKDIDVAILEVGLGGRLDAVNAFEPNCSIVTSVDLDHQEFLGYTRDSIGFEKAGVYRTSVTAICGDESPPESLVVYAKQIRADFKCIQRDFGFLVANDSWQYVSKLNEAIKVNYTLPFPQLQGIYQLNNAACAIAAVESLQSNLPVPAEAISDAMTQVILAGRFQVVSKVPLVILDVAHNPHAARALAGNLSARKALRGHTLAVFGMLSDKDIKGVVDAVKHEIDVWYVVSIDHARGALALSLAKIILEILPNANVKIFESATHAYQQACIDFHENDKIIVFGSFFTVSTVLQVL